MTEAKLHKQLAALTQRPSPCSVERTHRSVIERKLLTSLEDDNTVAALFSKQDLEDIIAALYGYELGERKRNVLSWEAHLKRRKDLADAMSQLLREAFPPNLEAGEAMPRSSCCQSPMRVASEGTTHWHECVKCGEACDPA